MSDLLTMSTDELTRAEVMQRLKDRTLTQLEVAAGLTCACGRSNGCGGPTNRAGRKP